jgi:hypothetical protein
MALREFWITVRTAAGLVAPRAIVDSPTLDPDTIVRHLRGERRWLTPRSVAGFDEADFGFLAEAERKRLTQLVKEFRAIASSLDPKVPGSKDAIARAEPLFRDIVEILAFDRYGDHEAYSLGKQIEQTLAADPPRELAELRFNTGLDHSGDPAIWIWVFLTDEAALSDERFLETAQRLRDLIDPVARSVVPDRWPYLSFRSLAERAEPMGVS